MEHSKCNICDAQISPGPGNWERHLQGKKHQKNASFLARTGQKHGHGQLASSSQTHPPRTTTSTSTKSKSIHIRGFPRYTTKDDLRQHFSQFGDVTDVFLQDKQGFAFIHFANESPVETLLQSNRPPQNILGKQVDVRPAYRNNPQTSSDAGTRSGPSEESIEKNIHTQLNELKSLDDQFATLPRLLGLSEQELYSRLRLITRLKGALSRTYPGCRLYQFGSSVNGLGNKGCDMDTYMDMNLSQGAVTEDYDGFSPLQSIANGSNVDRIKHLRKTLGRNHHLNLRNLFAIPSNRCPIVRFIDGATQIQCDISVSSRLSMKNTELIQFLLAVDSRVKPLTFALRHWARKKEITAGGASGQKLSNYALFWMVVTHLQKVDPPILPSILSLINLADERDKCTIDSWTCGFTKDKGKLVGIGMNESTLEELMKGFFELYSPLFLSDFVISARTAEIIPLDTYVNTCVPEEKMKLGPVNIQDPFVLNHNIGFNMNESTRDHLLTEMKEANAKTKHENFSSAVQGENWGLNFLVYSPNLIKVEPSATHGTGLVSDGNTDVLTGAFDISMDFSLMIQHVSSDLQQGQYPWELIKTKWVEIVIRIYMTFLENLFLFSCVEIVQGKHPNDIESSQVETNVPDAFECDQRSKKDASIVDQSDAAVNLPEASSGSTEQTQTLKRQVSCESTSEGSSSKKIRLEVDPETQPAPKVTKIEQDPLNSGEVKSPKSDHERKSPKSDHEIIFEAQYQTSYQLWCGRKKAGKNIKSDESSGIVPFNEFIESEKYITKALLPSDGENQMKPDPIMAFHLRIVKIDSQFPKLCFLFRPTQSANLFTSFYPFMKSMFTKMLNRYTTDCLQEAVTS